MYVYDMIGCVCVSVHCLIVCGLLSTYMRGRRDQPGRLWSRLQHRILRTGMSCLQQLHKHVPACSGVGGLTGADNAISPNSQQDREAYLGDGELPFNVGFFHGLNSTGLAIAEAMAP